MSESVAEKGFAGAEFGVGIGGPGEVGGQNWPGLDGEGVLGVGIGGGGGGGGLAAVVGVGAEVEVERDGVECEKSEHYFQSFALHVFMRALLFSSLLFSSLSPLDSFSFWFK